MAHSLDEIITRAIDQLSSAGVDRSEVDAEVLAAHVLAESRGRVQMLRSTGAEIGAADRDRFETLVARRASREPLQHITGLAPFRYLELEVGPGVFIPRPESELVTEFALRALRDRRDTQSAEPLIAVDLCAGSGAIGLAIATEARDVSVWAVEKSADAFAWAERNRARLAPPTYTLVRGEVVDALPELNGRVSVLASNPPYIPDDAIPRDIEVRSFDPHMALFGGADGLDVVRQVSAAGVRLLQPGASIVIEHGELQGSAVREILEADGYVQTQTHPDLTGRDRFTSGVR